MKIIDFGMIILIATIVIVSTMVYSVVQQRRVRSVTEAELNSLIYSQRIQSADWNGEDFTAVLNDGEEISARLPRPGSIEARRWEGSFRSQNIQVRESGISQYGP